MSVSGPNNGAQFTNDGTGAAWVNPSNAQTSNSVYTTVTAARRMVVDSGGLVCSHFDFSIPAGSVIDGIKLELQRKYAGGGGSVTDLGVSLTKDASSPTGSTSDSNAWTTSLAYYTWGGPTDLWGETWTPAEINDDGFGSINSATVGAGALASCVAYIDHVRITVYYTAPSGAKASTMMTMGVG